MSLETHTQASAPSAGAYYRLTEASFLALCPSRSSHMNMGLWPAASLEAAQKALVRETLDFHVSLHPGLPKGVLDAGSGWGGSRRFFAESFPGVPYTGVNLSPTQIAHAMELNRGIPNTRYLNQDIRAISATDLGGADTLFSIEAAFHFPEKARVLKQLSEAGITSITVADICLADGRSNVDGAYLYPALDEAWSESQYREALLAAGYREPVVREITANVYDGWSEHLMGLDPKSYGGHPRILRQFQKGFADLAALARAGEVRYLLIHSTKA